MLGHVQRMIRGIEVNDETLSFEVRYGDAQANALQRGLWTNTNNALPYFKSLTNGWISYSHNIVLVHLFSHALVSSNKGHSDALEVIKNDIERLVKQEIS